MAGDGQFLGSHAEGPPPPRGVAPDFERAAMESAEDARNDSRGVLAIHHLAKAYKARRVVEDVSLHVRRGEAVGLLGPNGAGKTTVFYMITGLVRPDKGTIALDGHDVTGCRCIGARGSASAIFRRKPRCFVAFRSRTISARCSRSPSPTSASGAHELEALLDEFEIKRLRKSPAIALSGGERRRCEIARALAGHPSFMLLDEPFAGIDPIAVGDIQELVRHLKGRGIGVLITDHNVRETLGPDRPRLYHLIRPRADRRPAGGDYRQSGRPAILSRRRFPDVAGLFAAAQT